VSFYRTLPGRSQAAQQIPPVVQSEGTGAAELNGKVTQIRSRPDRFALDRFVGQARGAAGLETHHRNVEEPEREDRQERRGQHPPNRHQRDDGTDRHVSAKD